MNQREEILAKMASSTGYGCTSSLRLADLINTADSFVLLMGIGTGSEGLYYPLFPKLKNVQMKNIRALEE